MNHHLKCAIKLPFTILLLPVFVLVLFLGMLSYIPLFIVSVVGGLSGCYESDPELGFYLLETIVEWYTDL